MGLDVGKITALLEVNDQWSSKLQHMARETSKASQVMGGDLARSARVAETAMAGTGQASNRLAAQMESTRRIHEYVAKQMVPHERAIEQQFKRTERAADDLVKAHERAANATVSGTTRSSGALASLGRTIVAAFAVERIVSYGTEVVKMASRINDAAAVAGMTTTEFQRLQYAGLQSGAGVDAITRAATQLSDRLVEGKKGTLTALHDLGLSLEALRGMGPAQAIEAVGDAIQKIPRGMQQSQVATELFGRGGAEILGALNAGLTTAGDEARRLGIIINEEDIVALDNMGDAWDRVALRAKAAMAGMMADLSRAFKQVTNQPDLSLKQVLQFAPKGSLGGGAFGMLAQEYLRMRMGAPDPVDLMTLNATQGRDIVLESAKKNPAFRPPRDPAAERLIREQQKRMDAISGRDVLDEASKSIAGIFGKGGVGMAGIGSNEAVLKVFEKLVDAKEIAKRIEPGAVAGITAALSALATHPSIEKAARASGAKLIASMLGPDAWKAARGSISGVSGADFLAAQYNVRGNPLPGLGVGGGDREFLRGLGIHEVEAIKKGLDGIGMPLKTINDGFYTWLERSRTIGSEIRTGIGGALMSLPALFQQAFTGGGGIVGAFKALGVQLANAVMTPILKSLQDVKRLGTNKYLTTREMGAVGAGAAGAGALGGAFGGTTGATIGSMASTIAGVALATTAWGSAAALTTTGMIALGAATLGIGVAAVGVYLLARKFFTVSKEVKQARADVQDFQQELWKTMTPMQVAEAGGRGWAATLITVRDAYVRMGYSAGVADHLVAQLLDTSRPEEARAAMAQINTVVGAFQNILAKANEQMGGLLDTALEMGQRLPDALLDSLARLRDMGDLSADNIALLEKLMKAPSVDYRKFEEAAGRYGINQDALGLGYHQSKATTTAQQMIDDVDLLSRGGASMGTILHGMREEISALVAASLQFGTTLPENMRPWIDRLAETGQLVDENGEAIKGLANLRFAESLETSFSRIADSIQKLVDLLTGPLMGAFNALPKSIGLDMDVNAPGGWQTQPHPYDTGTESTGFAGGTLSRGSWFRNFGAGTPTVLHGTEAVVRPDQTGAFVAAFGGGAAGGQPITVRGNIVTPDGRVLSQFVMEHMDGVLAGRGVRR